MTAARISVLLVALLALACSSTSADGKSGNHGGDASDIVCPSIAKEPTALIDLGAGALRDNGRYAIEFEADGKHESCELEISGMGPSNTQCVGEACAVESPSTRTTTTCTLVDVAGIQDDGSIKYFSTKGTPKQFSLTLSRDGSILVSGTAAPDYEPDRCGFIEPTVTLESS